VLTDEISGQIFLRSIFNPTHHFVLLCLDFLAVIMAFVRKRCGGKFGWSVLVDSLPKLIFSTLRYCSTITTNPVVSARIRNFEGENHGDHETWRLHRTGEESSRPPQMFSCIAPARGRGGRGHLISGSRLGCLTYIQR
jgi:hypothetical protein